MALKFITIEKQLQDYTLRLKMNEDMMKAYIEISKNKSSTSQNDDIAIFPNRQEIIYFLDENGINFGLDYVNIENISSNKITKATLVASGIMPIKGEDARISYKHDFSKKINLIQDENGNIDFKSLNWFTQVRKGDVVATKIPAQRGINGKNIKGDDVIAPLGKDISIVAGKNVIVDSQSGVATSMIDGMIELSNAKVSVNEILQIKGDIDTSTGNINFPGDIFVLGDIKSTFKVEADGSLDVKGVIEASDIFVGGDLIVKGGIKGSDNTKIVVKGSIVCKFIENANIFVNGDIDSDFIIHSNVMSGGKINLKGKKSVLAGGQIIARDSITTSVIGSHMGTKTLISLGVDIDKEASLVEKKNLLDNLSKELNKLVPIIETGKEMISLGGMDQKRKESFFETVRDYESILSKVQEVAGEIKEIEDGLLKHKFSYLIAKENIFPGVSVTILRYSKFINDFLGPSKIYLKNREIMVEEG